MKEQCDKDMAEGRIEPASSKEDPYAPPADPLSLPEQVYHGEKPPLVAILGWLLIAKGLLWMLLTTPALAAMTVLQVSSQDLMELLRHLVCQAIPIACGLAFLKGIGWGRYVLIGYVLFSKIISLVLEPRQLWLEDYVISIGFVVVFYLCLFNRKAKAYFRYWARRRSNKDTGSREAEPEVNLGV